MIPRRTSWLPIAAVLVPVTLAVAWLLLVLAGDSAGVVRLPAAVSTGSGEAHATVEFFSERGRPVRVEEVVQRPAEVWQRRTEPGAFAAAKPRGAAWARITLRNPAEQTQRGVLVNDYFFTDRIEAWWREGNEWRRAISGEAVAANEKAIAGREIAFAIEVPAHGERVVYLRAEDRFGVYLQPAWWPEAADFYAAKARGGVAEGIYFGGLLALLGYNVLLWLRLRLADIGCYVRYLGATAAFIFLARGGLPAVRVALGSPAIEMVIVLTVGLSAYYLTQFARVFLELASRAPRADRVARALALLAAAVGVGALGTPWLEQSWGMRAAVALVGITHLTLPVLAILAWRAGAGQARLFLLAFGFLFAGTLASAIGWWQRVLTDGLLHCVMIGSALEMLVLSLAVAERFAQAQRDKLLAQEQLAAETERRRALQEAYADELEAEVRDRTRELEEANADKDRMLAIIGHDLRSPLAGLMRAADDEPGAFARETARTGRALLLLIEDLVLWARLRAGTRHLASHPAQALLAPAVALHRALAERGGTELVVSVADGLRVETDLVLAQTLVRNLLANALKFARTRVVLRAEELPAAGGGRITVGNDGPPLAPAVAARFAAGQNEPMTATGGLGLRLCREICAAFGTRLEAGTGADGGTEFSFTLPAARNAAREHS